LEPTQAGNTSTPAITDVPKTEEPIKPTSTPEFSKSPSTENSTEIPTPTLNPTEVVTPTVNPTETATSTAKVSPTPSLVPTATAQTPVTCSAVISKIEDGTIYIDDNRVSLMLTPCITYYKTCFDGTLYDITLQELLPGDTIEITYSGLISNTYPISFLADCEQIVVIDSVANAIVEDKISNLSQHALEMTNNVNTKFYLDEDTKIYKNGQEITIEQLNRNDVIRICAYNPTIKGGMDTVFMTSYKGYARTIMVLGDAVDDLQKEQAYFLFDDTYNDSVIWYTSQGSYLISQLTPLH